MNLEAVRLAARHGFSNEGIESRHAGVLPAGTGHRVSEVTEVDHAVGADRHAFAGGEPLQGLIEQGVRTGRPPAVRQGPHVIDDGIGLAPAGSRRPLQHAEQVGAQCVRSQRRLLQQGIDAIAIHPHQLQLVVTSPLLGQQLGKATGLDDHIGQVGGALRQEGHRHPAQGVEQLGCGTPAKGPEAGGIVVSGIGLIGRGSGQRLSLKRGDVREQVGGS